MNHVVGIVNGIVRIMSVLFNVKIGPLRTVHLLSVGTFIVHY